jgi:hypothetical protein
MDDVKEANAHSMSCFKGLVCTRIVVNRGGAVGATPGGVGRRERECHQSLTQLGQPSGRGQWQVALTPRSRTPAKPRRTARFDCVVRTFEIRRWGGYLLRHGTARAVRSCPLRRDSADCHTLDGMPRTYAGAM